MVTYHHQSATDLPPELWQRWSEILESRPDLDSAFFHPELTRRTAAVRNDIEVGIIKETGEPVGFFPFLRGPRGLAQSIPGRLSEFHGVISQPGVNWSPEELIQACDLNAWYFDHLPSTQTEFQDHIWREATSPYMDLSQGYVHYREEIKKSGSSLTQVERKRRKLEREIGPLEFTYHSTDEGAFQSLLEWKAAQHQRTNVLQVLKVDWVVNLLKSLIQNPLPGFAGNFSLLKAGDELVAVHLGLRTATNLHIWFPTYNSEFEKYSPGLVLLLELAQAGANQGITRIDFGKGAERYKQNFKSGDTLIAEGSVDQRVIAGSLRRCWHSTKQWMRSSRFSDQLEIPINATRKVRQWLAFR